MKMLILGRFRATVSLLAFGGFLCVNATAAPFRFVVWGDATDLLEHVRTNAAQINGLRVLPKFNLFAGDLYDTGFSAAAASALQEAMGNSLSETMFPVRGNHDIIGGADATAGWQAWFDLAERVSSLGASNYAWMSGCTNLTYSFDYETCHFAGLDIPGDVTLVQAAQLGWLDADLAAAEGRGCQQSFLFFHGPVYSCGSRHGGIDAPPQMIDVLNKHRSVSAIFGGHSHVFAWTHMYTNRIARITHPFEAFIVPAVAENIGYLDDTNRCDYGMGGVRGFITVDVDGPSFTVSLHVQGRAEPVFTKGFPLPPLLRSPASRTQEFQFYLDGELGRSYRIEKSANGMDWIPIRTNIIFSAQAQAITEPLDRNAPQQFYRCVLAP